MNRFHELIKMALNCFFLFAASSPVASEMEVKKVMLSPTDDKVIQLNIAMSELLKRIEASAFAQSEGLKKQEKSVQSLRIYLDDRLQSQLKLQREIFNVELKKLETNLSAEIVSLKSALLRSEREARAFTELLKDDFDKQNLKNLQVIEVINERIALSGENNKTAFDQIFQSIDILRNDLEKEKLFNQTTFAKSKDDFDKQKLRNVEVIEAINERIALSGVNNKTAFDQIFQSIDILRNDLEKEKLFNQTTFAKSKDDFDKQKLRNVEVIEAINERIRLNGENNKTAFNQNFQSIDILRNDLKKETLLNQTSFAETNAAVQASHKELYDQIIAQQDEQSAKLSTDIAAMRSQIMAEALPQTEKLLELSDSFDQEKMFTHRYLVELNENIKSLRSDVHHKLILQENKQTETSSIQRKTTANIRNGLERMLITKVAEQTVDFEEKINELRAEMSNKIDSGNLVYSNEFTRAFNSIDSLNQSSQRGNDINMQSIVALEEKLNEVDQNLKSIDAKFNEKLNSQADEQSLRLTTEVKNLNNKNADALKLNDQNITLLNSALRTLNEQFDGKLDSLAAQKSDEFSREISTLSTNVSNELDSIRETQLGASKQVQKSIKALDEISKRANAEHQRSISKLEELVQNMGDNVGDLLEKQQKLDWQKRFSIFTDANGYAALMSKENALNSNVIIPKSSNCPKLGEWLIENVPMRDANRFYVIANKELSVCKIINDTWSIVPIGLGEKSHLIFE